MRYVRLFFASAVAGIMGGVLFTLLSGLYAVRPFASNAETIHFGFPFAWLEAGRITCESQINWSYFLIWKGLIVDFMIYVLVSAVVMCAYFVVSVRRKQKM